VALTPTTTAITYTDNPVSANSAYLYRVRATLVGGGFSDYSNVDLATTVIFSEDPLVSYAESQATGAPATPIRAIHINQLRDAVDGVHMLAGLGHMSWIHPVSIGGDIHVEDVTDLRAGLNQAFAALGLPAPSYHYALDHGSVVHKDDVQELRAAVK
jgi:hypothetical protein